MDSKHFKTEYCKGTVTFLNDYNIEIECTITDTVTDDKVSFLAAAPPDTMTTFSGSGLPYATYSQAFYNTPNRGTVKLVNNSCNIKLLRPNSYYANFNDLKLPHVIITYNKNKKVDIVLASEKIAYRSLQYPSLRKSQKEMFYNRDHPIRSQEKILRDSEYDSWNEHKNFWGLKPPV
jgi:hypothetical protein